MAQAYNLSYSDDRDREDLSSRPVQTKSSQDRTSTRLGVESISLIPAIWKSTNRRITVWDILGIKGDLF
jgi:hypothetical protein